MNKDVTAKILFDTIIDMVVREDHSPYSEMMKKAKDIDVDYFEDICRGTNSLSDELNLELKDKVVEAFSKMADGYYAESDLESRLVAIIQREVAGIRASEGDDACNDFLDQLSTSLKEYVNSSSIHAGFSKYTNADVAALYQDAKRVSLKEFILGTNDEDILNFYNALLDNTWWACREVIVSKTNAFLLTLAAKTGEGIENVK